jgi:hypothetical protein
MDIKRVGSACWSPAGGVMSKGTLGTVAAAVVTVATMSACGDPNAQDTPVAGQPPGPVAQARDTIARPVDGQASATSEPREVAPPVAPAPGVDTASPATVGVPPPTEAPPTTGKVGGGEFVVESKLGDVHGRVPDNAGPDPIAGSYPDPPPFVEGHQRWVVGECCRLGVIIQNEKPLFPDDAVRAEIAAGDLHWTIYNTGANDGESMSATTTVGPMSIIVGAQILFRKDMDVYSLEEIVTQVIETITISATGGQA